MPTDAEIASRARLHPITEVAARLGIPADALELYGPHKAKLSRTFLHNLQERPSGKLILVTAISPTPAGEGKSTTVVGLADALNRIGKRAAVCLREPSLGPCFGMKGGATGGGKAQVVPMEDINLHFTGDMHAITTAHNLLTALIDNHLHHGNALDIDPRRIVWRRVMDLNDRALRQIVTGGEGNGYRRKAHFDITVASEVMAILCLATSIPDLRHRLGEILVAYGRDGRAIYARDLHAHGAMAALLKDAVKPNLVQTMEHTPAFIHGGPFANIAHGCNSIAATQAALKLADYVVTEAGFGADLGAEKFLDIKCRKAGLWPDVAVLVATVRALKFHGGVEKEDLDRENLTALRNGIANLRRHLENLQDLFGLPVVVAINPFPTDTTAELVALQEEVARLGSRAIISRHWAEGSAGATELAEVVAATAETSSSQPQFLYDNDLPLWRKIETIAKRVYRAEKVVASESVKRQLRKFDAEHRHFPVCMAKTQYSFSSNPALRGAPEGHEIKVTEVRLSRGAGFVVAVCGNIMTMPGLPKVPASMHITLSDEGIIAGLS
jgi:formate--tetrahydrofolate ligase